MIKISIIGRVGQDATVQNVNGKNVINFSVCHSEKDRQGKEQSTWVQCSWWMENTNIAQYIKKGGLVHVEGKPIVAVYNEKAQQKMMVRSVDILVFPQQGAPAASTTQNQGAVNGDPDADLPF